MKKYKFLKSIVPDEVALNNGVTDTYLMQLSNEIMSYSDWIFSTTLIIDEETGLDTLMVEFTDIDNTEYWCQIFSDFSFEIYNEHPNIRGGIEITETREFNPERLSDCNNFITYLKNMPKTIKTLL